MNSSLVTSPYLSLGLGLFLALMGGFNVWQERRQVQPEMRPAGGRRASARTIMTIIWGLVLVSGVLIVGLELFILA